jgi:hypothetical protein
VWYSVSYSVLLRVASPLREIVIYPSCLFLVLYLSLRLFPNFKLWIRLSRRTPHFKNKAYRTLTFIAVTGNRGDRDVQQVTTAAATQPQCKKKSIEKYLNSVELLSKSYKYIRFDGLLNDSAVSNTTSNSRLTAEVQCERQSASWG